VDPDFGGEVADFYHQYRRGYPPAVIDTLAGAFGLTGDDLVIDLGCGTGQLTLPIAARVRAVVGVDPELDMLAHGRRVRMLLDGHGRHDRAGDHRGRLRPSFNQAARSYHRAPPATPANCSTTPSPSPGFTR